MKTLKRFSAILIFCLAVGTASAAAQTNEFTYQGKLTDSITPSATYDFEFRLCSSETGDCTATPVLLETRQRLSVAVSNGIFTVKLDFDAAHFTGADRFLEISVRRMSSDPWTPLNPRQKITSAPYSIRSLTAATANTATNAQIAQNADNLGGQPASGFVQIGSTAFIRNQSEQQTPADFNISGTGTADVFNANLQYNIGGQRVLSIAGSNNIFAGLLASGNSTTSFNNSFFGVGAGFFHTTGNFNSFFGEGAGRDNTTGNKNTIIGASANVGTDALTYATALGSEAVVRASNTIVLGRENGSDSVTIAGNVGIGTTAPQTKLHVSGSGMVRARVNSDSNTGLALTINDQPGWSLATIFDGQFQILNDALGASAVWIDHESNSIGIGTTNPLHKLHVIDFSNTGLRVQTNAPGGRVASFGGNGAFDVDAPGVFGGRFKILEDGNVGIGTAFPDQRLTVNGNASKLGGGSWAVFSDERLKNVSGRFTRGLGDLMRLNPIRFEYKPDNALGLRGEGEYVGFSAQELALILPEAVSRSENGYLQINNDPILWTMLNAVKEQQTQIEQQQQQNKLLREQHKRQQQQIDALKLLVCELKPEAAVCKEERK